MQPWGCPLVWDASVLPCGVSQVAVSHQKRAMHIPPSEGGSACSISLPSGVPLRQSPININAPAAISTLMHLSCREQEEGMQQ